MSRNFTLNSLTEGIRDRHVGAESRRLQEKWTRTGLLRGLKDYNRETMSRLLENQAAQALREANTIGNGAGGDNGNINGFTNIAFPIVRRVFGGLVANELVSIQPMSLPSGLLFYLDYTYGSDVGGDDVASGTPDGARASSATFAKGDSLYGAPTGRNIRTGADAVGGQYDLAGSTFTKVHSGSTDLAVHDGNAFVWQSASAGLSTSGADGKLLQFDPQLSRRIDAGTHTYSAVVVSGSLFENADLTNVKSLSVISAPANVGGALTAIDAEVQQGANILNVRRLNEVGEWNGTTFTPNPFASAPWVKLIVESSDPSTANTGDVFAATYAIADSYQDGADGTTGTTITIPTFESDFAAGTPQPIIPEIDIKIESIAVTATTRKLRARWSPELAQDLNAYHSMDAEVELTQILSEQIALEIDREILNDLLVEARGANFYWSRSPGKFVNKVTGQAQVLNSSLATGPQFTGTVREWYETLVETIIDVANEIHRKTLRGSANFIVVSPEVATIFEASVLYKPSIKIDGQGQTGAPFSIGAEAIGSLSNRFTVYKDPYFPRNKILVGYKGGSYLESGYVYAPYVPLIVTPTIFAPEDFTPRKGVMTRYGKKMVRADFYGTVTCLDMDII